MKITEETLVKLPEKEQDLVRALLSDINEINNAQLKPPIYLDWCDEHTQWPCERTDPCPDYYGTYSIRRDNVTVGMEMDLETLDYVLCALINYIEL